jgi:Ca-activated chloride channel family protein
MSKKILTAMVAAALLVAGCSRSADQAQVETVVSDTTSEAASGSPGPTAAPSGVPVQQASASPAPPAGQEGGSAGGGAMVLVMDASGSMHREAADGGTLLDGAKQALHDMVNGLPDGTHAGLRVYGHRVDNTDKQNGCKDTELIHPVEPLDRDAMNASIDEFGARGFTPIGLSLQEAADDLPPEGPRTIILVSDGEDTCAPPDPCDVAATLREDGIDLKIHTVGFGLGDDNAARNQLECIAEAGGGRFHDVADAEALSEELVDISARAVRQYETQGQRVEGGPAYQEAPVLAPGTYSDTILAREELWYAVELQEGQQLTVRSTLVVDDREFGGIGALFEVQLVNPLLEELCCNNERGYEVNVGVPDPARTVNIGAQTLPIGSDESNPPGTYYIRIVTDSEGDDELPIELTIDVT